MTDDSSGISARLQRLGTAVENWLLVLLLGAMMVLAVGQIILRKLDAGVLWADELLKILVLWVALVASVAASRSRRHLRIDVLSRYVPERFSRLPGVLVDAFAAGICGIIAWHAARYIVLSIDETVLIDTPAWLAYGIVPLAFALMCYRFTLYFFKGLIDLRQRSSRQDQPG